MTVVARTPCGSFEIRSDGSVARHRSSWAPSWAPGAVSHPAPGIWVAHPHGRLALYRDGKLWWLSRIKHASDEVVVSGASIAFAVYRRDPSGLPELWLARAGGHEFRAARHEEPVGWTRGGLVTVNENVLRVRGPDGTVYRTLGDGHSALAEPATGTALYVSRRGELVRTDGRRSWRLARDLGQRAWVQRLDGGVLDVSNGRRSLFLRSDGSRLRIVAPVDESAGAMGAAIALPHGSGVAYVVTRGRRGSDAGVNVVYLASPQAPPRRLFAKPVPRLSCGEYASLSYAAGRILYVDDEGPIAVLDPSGRTGPLDLTGAFAALQPRRAALAQLNADWAAKWR